MKSSLSLLLVGVFISSLSYVENQDTDISTSSRDLANAIDQFAAKLYSKSKIQNYFISPYSIWMALSMCYVGARGTTSTELKDLLSYGNITDAEMYKQIDNYQRSVINAPKSKYTLNLANRIFTNASISFKQEYVNLLEKYFKLGIEKVNFSNSVAAAETINRFVSNKTNNRIKNIVEPSMLNKTDLMVVNTLYFKAYWYFRFKNISTEKANFTTPEGRQTSVNMMSLRSKFFDCLVNMKEYDLATACEIPFEESKIAMTILLPHRNSSLSKLEKILDINSFKKIVNSEKNSTKLNFYLPRFTINYKQEMSKDLISLGAKTPFDDNADFSGISTSKKFKISSVIHQTFVNVNEDGAEAAAATIIEMLGSTPSLPVEFKCDRPFIFMIHDLTNRAILFIGKLTNP